MSFRKRSLSALKWSFLDKWMKRGVSFVISLFLARLLEPSDYGLLAMAMVFVAMGALLSDIGIGQAIIQADELTDQQCSTIFYINLGSGVFLFVVQWFASPYIADFYGDVRLLDIVRVVSVTYIFSALNLVHGSLFYRDLNIKSVTQLNVISDISSGIMGIIMAYMGYGVWSLVYQKIFRGIIYSTLIWWKSRWFLKWYFNFREIKDLFSYGMNIFGVGLIQELSGHLDTILMGKFLVPSFLGLFDRGKSFPVFIKNTFILPLTRPLFPIFSNIKNDKKSLKSASFEVLDNLLPLLFLGYGMLAVFSEEIIRLLLTEKWISAAPYMRIFAFAMVFSGIYGVSTSLYKATGEKSFFLWNTFVEKVLMVGALLLGLFVDINYYLAGMVVVSVIIVLSRVKRNERLLGAGWWKYFWYHILFGSVAAILTFLKMGLEKYFNFAYLVVFLLFIGVYALFYRAFVAEKTVLIYNTVQRKAKRKSVA